MGYWYEKLQDKEDQNCLEKISESLAKKSIRIKYLEEENKKLKDEHYKDDELERLKKEIDRLHADCVRGFPITEGEKKKINAIKEKHKKTCPYCNFKYIFESFAIVEFGYVKCTVCGDEFKFYEH